MDNFICKVANRDELLKRWEYLIKIHPGNNKWVEYKKDALKHYDEGSIIPYLESNNILSFNSLILNLEEKPAK